MAAMGGRSTPRRRGIQYSDYALERFRQLHLQKWVIAEIMRINADELEPVQVPNPLEGFVDGHGSMMWRRAVRRADIDKYLGFEIDSPDELSDACNYVTLYRWATTDEIINSQLEGDTLLVTSILSNLELARYVVRGR